MAENAQTTETNAGAPETTDYKALYEETLKRAETAEAEAKKQKGLKDTYATENADYKRQEADRKKKELESLPEVDRLKEQLEAERNATKEANERIAKMEHRQSGLENGFTADEVEKLAGTGVDFKVLKDIISARVEEAVKSAKAEATKTSTAGSQLGNGSADTKNQKSDFQLHQESKRRNENIVKL